MCFERLCLVIGATAIDNIPKYVILKSMSVG